MKIMSRYINIKTRTSSNAFACESRISTEERFFPPELPRLATRLLCPRRGVALCVAAAAFASSATACAVAVATASSSSPSSAAPVAASEGTRPASGEDERREIDARRRDLRSLACAALRSSSSFKASVLYGE